MSGNLKRLLADGRLKQHTTSRAEVEALRGVIERDLTDAGISGLSTDRRFATAYNAALQACRLAIASAGYRLSTDTGHHALTFEIAAEILPAAARTYTEYFDVCRRKRNQIDYFHSFVASETEAQELVQTAAEFVALVDAWIENGHPELHR